MGNIEQKKNNVGRNIPRNPNRRITDDEVNLLLKEAAEQISAKEKKAGIKSSGVQRNKAGDVTIATNKQTVTDNKSRDGKISNANTLQNRKIENNKSDGKKTNLNTAANRKVENRKQEEKKQNVNALEKRKLEEKGQNINASERRREQEKGQNINALEKRKLEEKRQNINTLEKSKQENLRTDNRKPNANSAISPQVVKRNDSIRDKENVVDFKLEDDIIVTKPSEVNPKKRKFGSIIGSILEGVWTVVKLAVLVVIVTAVVGFFMSRDLMIRGRSGARLSAEGMSVSAVAVSNKSESREKVKSWVQNVNLEKLTLEADDGNVLVARKFVENKDSNKWVVILHGQNGSMEDIYDIAIRYMAEGYNVLMPDLRANGESEGSFYGMGWLDRLDVINWIDVILEENPSAQVVIHGIDMGADTALMIAGEPLKSSIKAIVAEGASTGAWDTVKAEYKARHENWPVFPIMHMMNPVMKVWAGYSLKDADTVKQVQKATVPILLIRGQNDTLISENMTATIEKAIASQHEVLTVTTGTHGDCRYAEPEMYYNATFDFIGQYVQ